MSSVATHDHRHTAPERRAFALAARYGKALSSWLLVVCCWLVVASRAAGREVPPTDGPPAESQASTELRQADSPSTPTVESPQAASADLLAWERLAVEPAPTFIAGETEVVRVHLRNVGQATWDSESTKDFLSYHLWSRDGALLQRDGIRTPFSQPVAPGESIAVDLTVRAPPQPGEVWLEVLPVREHVRWFPAPRRDHTGLVDLPIEQAYLAWDLEYEQTPRELAIDSHAMVPVRIYNAGSEPWGPTDFLSYHWLTDSGEVIAEGPRTPFDGVVAPGQAIEVSARVNPPPRRGDLFLRWRPVRENVRWFGPPPEHANSKLPVHVTPPELSWRLVDIDMLPSVWVNHSFRVDVTLQNTGTATWSEDTGDHLSYHWLDEHDGVVQFDGRRSSYLHPVGPGETVTVSALVSGPTVAGSYKLQWEPVREHVRWFGPPTAGPRTLLVETRRLSTWLQLACAFAGLALVGIRRRGLLSAGFGADTLVLLWGFCALVLVSVTFAELASLEMWTRALTYTWSGAAGVVLPLCLLHGRHRVVGVAALLVFANALAFADLVYMHFFGAIVPVTALTAAHQAGELGASIAELVEASYVWLLPAPLAALIVAARWPQGRAPRLPTLSRFRRLSRRAVPLVCALATIPLVIRLHTAMTGKLGQRVYSEARNVSRLGVLNAHVFDVVRTVYDATSQGELDAETWASVESYYRQRAGTAAQETANQPDFGLASGANLLLIQVEAAQGFVVDAEVGGQPIAPFMRSLVDRGLAFPNVFDQTHHGKTSDSEYLTLTSNHPLKAGALAFLRASNHFVTLAHVLRERGYHTLSSHPYKRGFWNRAALHPRYGFERSLFRRELGAGQEVGWGLADGLFFERILPELSASAKPFFAFLITLSLHHPYDTFPDNLKFLDLGELEGTNLGNYLHGMHYFDRSLEQLFRGLAAEGLLDNTIVALFGDHDSRLPYDAALRELVGVGNWSPSLEQRLERIPLFIVLPNNTRTGVVTTTGGQLDIAPTLLHYLGLPRPSSYLGRPLLAGITGRVAAYPDGSAFTDDRMFVATGQDIPALGGCFHLPSGKSRRLRDCDAIRDAAKIELEMSRLVLDHDLQPELSSLGPVAR